MPETSASSSLPSTSELSGLLRAAEDCARAAGDVTLRYYDTDIEAEWKQDATPVTAADREAESLIRDRIHRLFPDHGVLGEEYGETNPGARIRWVIDPIDGTKSFLRAVPLYGVLIGVEVEGSPAVGVAYFPVLGELVSAARGMGCFRNGQPAAVSSTDELQEAVVLTTSLGWAASEEEGAGFRGLVRSAALARTWGDCYGHILVATGRADVMVDPVLSPWDAGPLLTILNEAGGAFTDLSGTPTIHGGSGVSTNGLLHQRVLEALAARR